MNKLMGHYFFAPTETGFCTVTELQCVTFFIPKFVLNEPAEPLNSNLISYTPSL